MPYVRMVHLSRSFSSLIAPCCTVLLHAQSIMYSPADATTSDFTEIPPFSGLGRLLDHSGLSVDFISGSTPWGAYNGGDLCGVTHSILIVDEFWCSVDTATQEVHLVLDMGLETSWDRMAFFNEESTGFGTGSLHIEQGPTGTGPWSNVGWWWLTEHTVVMDYGPDLVVFPVPIITRYLRLTAQPRPPDGGSATTELSIGEIILGTAGPDAPEGSCTHLDGTGVQDGNTTPVALPVVVRTPDHALITSTGSPFLSATCSGADGRLLPVQLHGGTARVTVPQPGACLCKLTTIAGDVHIVRSFQ